MNIIYAQIYYYKSSSMITYANILNSLQTVRNCDNANEKSRHDKCIERDECIERVEK